MPEYTANLIHPSEFWTAREKLSKCLIDLVDYGGRLDSMITELEKQVKKEEKEKLNQWTNAVK